MVDESANQAVQNSAFSTLYDGVGENLREYSAGARGELRLIDQASERSGAVAVLDALRRAVLRLEDLGLSDEQRAIINEEMLPLIDSLKELVGESVADSQRTLRDQRRRSLWDLGTLRGLATALVISIGTLAVADDALVNVRDGAAELDAVRQLIAE